MNTPTSFAELVNGIVGLINVIIPTLFGVVFVFIVWKIFDSWVINAADERKREEGKQYALVSVIVLAIMSLTWGLVVLLQNSFF